jgi:uncharacterized membrane protein YfcA
VELAIAGAVGLAAGVLSGMFGIGGGLVIVPALVLLMDFPAHRAVGTSLAALVLPVAIFGVLNYARTGNVDFKVALVIALALAVAVPIGSQIALSIDKDALTRMFGALLMFVAIRFLFFAS